MTARRPTRQPACPQQVGKGANRGGTMSQHFHICKMFRLDVRSLRNVSIFTNLYFHINRFAASVGRPILLLSVARQATELADKVSASFTIAFDPECILGRNSNTSAGCIGGVRNNARGGNLAQGTAARGATG